jgi:hypothetical protein
MSARKCMQRLVLLLLLPLWVACSILESTSPEDVLGPADIIEQLRTACEDRNIAGYSDCLDDSFVFHLHEHDWYYPPQQLPPDTTWDRELEICFNNMMFAEADSIELILDASQPYIWPDDPSALGMECPFQLTVYVQGGSYSADGQAVFRFIKSVGDGWIIDYWKDCSVLDKPVEYTWGNIKALF